LHDVVSEQHTERQTSLLVRANGHVYDASWELHQVDLEEIVLAYLARDRSALAETARSA
jgi:ABC-2 type transport system ATP-binding protein